MEAELEQECWEQSEGAGDTVQEGEAEVTSQRPSERKGSGKESCHPVSVAESLLWLQRGGPEKDIL